jgi:integrase
MRVSNPSWRAEARPWPFDVSGYDREPSLGRLERQALDDALKGRASGVERWVERCRPRLHRLLSPLDDALEYVSAARMHSYGSLLSAMLSEVVAQDASYWAWTSATWERLLGKTAKQFLSRVPATGVRGPLIAVAYVLGGMQDIHSFGPIGYLCLAQRVFGTSAVDTAIATVATELTRIGYGATLGSHTIPTLVPKLLLATRRPTLEGVTLELLDHIRHNWESAIDRQYVVALSTGLRNLGIVDGVLSPQESNSEKRTATTGVPMVWLSYLERWNQTSTLEPKTRLAIVRSLHQVGRWAASTRSDLEDPAAWKHQDAVELIAAINTWKKGEWCSGEHPRKRAGEPYAPSSRAGMISAVRTFFRDCQDWGWIAAAFNPQRVLLTPRTLSAKLCPNPRVIADDIWAKLMWAALNLTEADLPKTPTGDSSKPGPNPYPIELVRATAITWIFAGIRSNELRRLRVGCVRWQHDDVRVSGEGSDLPRDAVCWLDIPITKTSRAFTKPVDKLVGEAIEQWELVRPKQTRHLDPKTGEMVDYLFLFRDRPLGLNFINHTLVPILCRKANVPAADARGTITSHRARSTIASQLYNSRDPLSLFELQEWLGHSSPHSTQYYAKVSPTKLAKRYQEAGYFERNVRTIEVLIDRAAIVSGAAANGTPWQYFDLGHGWCTNAYFVACPHRMACAKCTFYVPKDSAKGQLLEGQANLVQMLQVISLTEDERVAVEEGIDLFEQLCEKLADVPTPAGPTPRQIGANGKRSLPILPTKGQ